MIHPDYSNRINAWDHNVVCISILDANSDLKSKIIEDPVRYNGIVTLELLYILER